MANWAIVIGIDEYWAPKFRLKACVKDAVKMTQWLLDPKGGKVLPQNLYLLTRPTPPPPGLGPIPGNVQHFDATFDLLVMATDNLMMRSRGDGERFFFYFSGHGITNASGIDAEEALVMADFTATLTNKALEFESLVEYFRATRFSQQFYIVDACRDVLDWGQKFRTSPFTKVGQIDPTLPPVQQYTLLATSPRIKAAAIGDKSAFTEELLTGLKGKGASKVLDIKTGEYVVQTSRLFKFVESQIAERKINVSDNPEVPIWQKPRINGEHGSEDPELARLSADAVDLAALKLFVEPNPAWPKAEVIIVNQFGEEKKRIKPITKAPENLSLPPMIYTARAAAPGYQSEQPRWSFDLYDTQELSVRLIPSPDDGSLKFATNMNDSLVAVDALIAETDAIEEVSTKGLWKHDVSDEGLHLEAILQTELTVRTSDPLARLEVADSQGKALHTGQGEVSASGLVPGFYRARLLTPEGQVVEKIIELSPGDEKDVTLEAPQRSQSALLKTITSSAQFTVLEDNALDVAETVGPMASAQLSTILALTGSVLNQDEKWGHRLRSLGLKSFREFVAPDATSGVHILSVVESDGPHRASAQLPTTKLRLWQIGGPRPESSTCVISESKIAGLYEFAQAAEPGSYFLSIEPRDGFPVVFALAILPERLTMLVFHYDARGQLHVFQYNLSLSQEKFKKLDHKHVRRLELAQRFYLSGRLDYALETARELLYAKWADPLAGSLGCYLLLRLGKPEELFIAVENMMRFYGQLCDSYVLKGEYEASLGNTKAARHFFNQGLELGVPVFADGLTRLSEAVRKYQLQEHPRAKLLAEMVNKRVRGFLWTAWMPSKEVRPAGHLTAQVVGDVNSNNRDYRAGGNIYTAENGDINIANRDITKVAGNLYQFHESSEQHTSLPQIFTELIELSRRSSPNVDVEIVEAVLDKLKDSATKIQQGDDSHESSAVLERRFKSLLDLDRAVGKLALNRLSDPAALVAAKIRQVAKEVRNSIGRPRND